MSLTVLVREGEKISMYSICHFKAVMHVFIYI